MRTINSADLLDQAVALEATAPLVINEDRSLSVDSSLIIALADEHRAQIAANAAISLDSFGATEPTLVRSLIDRPTALARVDCTIDPETGEIFAYETDERPAGIGVSDRLQAEVVGRQIGKQIIGHLENIFGQVPVVKRHPSEPANDDGMLFKVEETNGKTIRARGRPILVRGNPNLFKDCDDLSMAAEKFSVSTISDEGKRHYRIATGQAILLVPTSRLPEESFVAKTLQGSQAKGVRICLSSQDAKQLGKSGNISQAKVNELLVAEGALIAEPFVPGVEVQMPDQKRGRLIMRVFCLVDQDEITVIGGTFVARPDHLVHGRSDALAGVVIAD